MQYCTHPDRQKYYFCRKVFRAEKAEVHLRKAAKRAAVEANLSERLLKSKAFLQIKCFDHRVPSLAPPPPIESFCFFAHLETEHEAYRGRPRSALDFRSLSRNFALTAAPFAAFRKSALRNCPLSRGFTFILLSVQ